LRTGRGFGVRRKNLRIRAGKGKPDKNLNEKN